MPHGDFSDYAAFFCLATGVTVLVNPAVIFQRVGPIQPLFDDPADKYPEGSIGAEVAVDVAASMTTLAKFAGGLLVWHGIVLFVNRWNVLNGKAAGLGVITAALVSTKIALDMDGGLDADFVLRPWWFFAVMFFLSFLHLSFNANPMHTSASLAKREAEKAAEKAKKAK